MMESILEAFVHGLVAALGAFLLFFLQPMIGKVLTPWFGGSAQVWITCMVFFQVLLLAGYGYAHALITRIPLRFQLPLHGAVLLAAILAAARGLWTSGVPLLPPAAWAPDPAQVSLVRDLLKLLLGSIGLPFFALASTAPLVQAWFARSFQGQTPYRLYAFSNVGSLAGLLLFPLGVEPFLSREAQAWLTFLLLVAYALLMARTAHRSGTVHFPAPAPEPSPRQPWGPWMLASAVGTILLMATTNHLATEVANIPLLWVLPLVAYLLTFVLWFDSRWLKANLRTFGLLLGGFLVALLLLAWARKQAHPLFLVSAATLVVFSGCLLVHGHLFSLRPAAGELTRYYFAMSTGGALGGLAVGLGAPLLFDRVHEFPLAICLCGLVALLWVRGLGGAKSLSLGAAVPLVLGLWAAGQEARRPGTSYRDEYGVVTVERPEGFKFMAMGRVIHGIQRDNDLRTPFAYYGPSSALGQVLRMQRARKGRLRLGGVGMGIGSLSAYGEVGDTLRFYEISPMVAHLAAGPRATFGVVNSCPAAVDIRIGDGRRLLEAELRQGSQGFDVLLVDAFSGGQVPWHLLTAEALTTFLDHVAPQGILLLHVSNRMPLDRLLAANAKAMGLWAAGLDHPSPAMPWPLDPLEQESHYVVLARDNAFGVNAFVALTSWLVVPPGAAVLGPKSQPKGLRGQILADSLQPWWDGRNSLAALVWAGRPGYGGWP